MGKNLSLLLFSCLFLPLGAMDDGERFLAQVIPPSALFDGIEKKLRVTNSESFFVPLGVICDVLEERVLDVTNAYNFDGVRSDENKESQELAVDLFGEGKSVLPKPVPKYRSRRAKMAPKITFPLPPCKFDKNNDFQEPIFGENPEKCRYVDGFVGSIKYYVSQAEAAEQEGRIKRAISFYKKAVFGLIFLKAEYRIKETSAQIELKKKEEFFAKKQDGIDKEIALLCNTIRYLRA